LHSVFMDKIKCKENPVPFQIHSLPKEKFSFLFNLSAEELANRNACRQIVKSSPGTPCRVSMIDARVGETVILLNYNHQPAQSPYKASHAIFVRENAEQAKLEPNTIPDLLATRLISVRSFNEQHMMIDANVVNGKELGNEIDKTFLNKQVTYIHLHNAKPGCFAAKVTRS